MDLVEYERSVQQGYKIQGIYYLNRRTHRIQQNVGGACPLLALCNILFLNHHIDYKRGGQGIPAEDLTNCLIQHLQNMLLNSDDEPVKTELIKAHHELVTQQDQNKNDNTNDVETLINKEKKIPENLTNIDKFAPLFSKLEQILDINIKFSDIYDFEQNPAYQLFNHFGITLCHAWVIDPKQQRLYNLIGNNSYKEATDFLISNPKEDATEQQKKQLEDDKYIIRKFLAECTHQVTPYGLKRLRTVMEDNELCILFRDNHFSMITQHDGDLFEFVTDEGIIDMDPQITWQTFFWNGIIIDPVFVNNRFQHTVMPHYVQHAKLGKPLISLKSNKHHYVSDRHRYKTPYVVGLLVDRYIRSVEHDTMNCIMIPDGINHILYTYLLYEYYKLLDAKIWISLLVEKCIKFTEPLLKQLADTEILCKLINKIKGDMMAISIESRSWMELIRVLEIMKIDAPCAMQDVFCNLYAVVQIIHNLSHKAKEIGFEGPFIDSEAVYELRNSYGLGVMTKTTKSLYELM